MVHHLGRTDSKDRMTMLNDHDSVSSGETTTTVTATASSVPKVEIDHCSDSSTSSLQKDSDSPPSSPSGYKYLLSDSPSDQAKFTPPECMHLLIGRMESTSSSNSTTQFLKKTETDPSLSLSDEVDFISPIFPLQCSAGVALLLKTNDIGFVHWNWPRIRLYCIIFFWAGMCALLACAVGLIVTTPRSCEPTRDWWEGAVVYEIFPAAFQDTNQDGSGDLQGIIKHLDYVKSLGATAIRLNSIFESDVYPTRYWATLNHTNVASHIGTIQDFEDLIHQAHARSLKVILDFNPLFISREHPFTDPANFESNGRTGHRYFFIKTSSLQISDQNRRENDLPFRDTVMLNLSHHYIQNKVKDALEFWLSKNVDGFYMKYIEHIDTASPNIQTAISNWRAILEKYSYEYERKALICHGSFADKLQNKQPVELGERLVLKNFDLVDYDIEMDPEELENLPEQLNRRLKTIFNKMYPASIIRPWIMWSVGSSEKSRLATRVGPVRSLATTLINLLLPGSVNLFYGDEVYLEDAIEQPGKAGPLVPMKWQTRIETDTHQIPLNNSIALKTMLDLLRNVLLLRNTSPPLLYSFIAKNEKEVVIPNYKVRLWQSRVLVLERFYPRWKSIVMLANLNQTTQQLDISSLYYQGKVVVSTHDKKEYIIFNNVQLKSGEVLITEI